MGYFKKVSAQLTRKELFILKQGDKRAFNLLSMDRQGEILTLLPMAFVGQISTLNNVNEG